nr:hypothetical protein [Pararhizobium sp. IMCC3301]
MLIPKDTSNIPTHPPYGFITGSTNAVVAIVEAIAFLKHFTKEVIVLR